MMFYCYVAVMKSCILLGQELSCVVQESKTIDSCQDVRHPQRCLCSYYQKEKDMMTNRDPINELIFAVVGCGKWIIYWVERVVRILRIVPTTYHCISVPDVSECC